MRGSEKELIVDARAELIARAKKGCAPLDPQSHAAVRNAIWVALYFAYLADLRPFAKWVSSALKQGKRAGAILPPPTYRKEAKYPGLLPFTHELEPLAARVYAMAIEYDVHAVAFREAARQFEARWETELTFEMIGAAPAHREICVFTYELAYALASVLPTNDIGPAAFALILAAIGTDPPIVLHSDLDTPAAAIAARALTRKEIWRRVAPRARAGLPKFTVIPPSTTPLILPTAGILLLSEFRSLSDVGETLATDPTEAPTDKSIRAERRSRHWLYADLTTHMRSADCIRPRFDNQPNLNGSTT